MGVIFDGKPTVTAARTVVVRDQALGISRKVVEGQPVPPDLVSAYQAAIDGGQPATVQLVEPVEDASGVEALDELSRDELNERARQAGVAEPEKLPNKAAVIKAIEEAQP